MFTKKSVGQKIRIISGKYAGHSATIRLVEDERSFLKPDEKKQVLIVQLDSNHELAKTYPNEVETKFKPVTTTESRKKK
jgi:transcription antitermination factor NusG